MRNKQITNAVALIIFLLLILLWTFLLNVRVKRELIEMRTVRDNASLTLHMFNMRKSDLFLEVWENRKDIYVNRNEVARVRAIMISSEYHIAMVPMLVPGKSVVPKAVLNQLKLQTKGGTNE